MTSSIEAVEIRARGFRLWAAPGHEERTRRSGLVDAEAFDALHASTRRIPGGRGENHLLEDAIWGETIRLRPGRHGGWLAPLLGDRFCGPGRGIREFETWLQLRSRGVSLPEPIFAIGRRRGLFWRTSLAIRDLPRAIDGADLLESRSDAASLRAVGEALATTLRRLHDAGALHGDLHLGNLLFEVSHAGAPPSPPRCWLIDLDRTRIVDRLTPADRMREWMRLARSIEKSGLAPRIPGRLRARVLARYCEGDRELRRAMLDSMSLETRRIARHRLAWRLGRALRIPRRR